MKRFLISFISLLMALSLVACKSSKISTSDIPSSQTTGVNESETIKNGSTTISDNKNTEINSNESSITHKEEPAKDVRIRLIFNNKEIIVKMNDNATSLNFVKKLPMTLSFKDYGGTEKISYLPQKLSTEGSPSGYDPSVGELAYYAPWGNICFYYRDFGYSTGLVPLGSIESGIEFLKSLDGDFTVTIKKY
ncbi:hypothetical protein LGK95_18250 [Clostridium algoriphilum]|uniref:cyclophilin-like fold protein n=1 Tax=Clostridium algoriphilum TaxID=198347 RepID=UPI001CF49146|nr:cyclophilin-like fold protein [Clostridium algoriphilum]MCB2295427.1 hypothetical protein [Clostridium algoriphilum]